MSKTKEYLMDSIYSARELLIQTCLADEDCDTCPLYNIERGSCTVGCPCFWDFNRKDADHDNISSDKD